MFDRLSTILASTAAQVVAGVVVALIIGGIYGYINISQSLRSPEPKERPDVRLSDEPPARLPPRSEYDRLQYRPDAK